jgi:CRISPR-associated exonuclease Cas4
MAQELEDPTPISALQHAVYCMRQAALIHVERQWQENVFTAEGRVLHDAVHDPHDRTRGRIRRVMALPVASSRLNLAGVTDLVEFRTDAEEGEIVYPVEYKRGRPKPHRADEVQLCAQAICLEEMLAKPVIEGALFYAQTRRRVVVRFDAELRELTERTAQDFAALRAAGRTPPAVYRASRCRACSLIDVCRPTLSTKSASHFVAGAIQGALDVEADAAEP